ncbi:hypothetical protein HK100_009805, partial [Physocladia obscura]
DITFEVEEVSDDDDKEQVKTVTVVFPFVKIVFSRQFVPSQQTGAIRMYLCEPDAAGRQVSKEFSLQITADGAASGSLRGSSLLPLLSVWNLNPRGVSKSLGKVLGYCIYCGHQMTQKESLERGTGEKCFKKYGIGDVDFILDNTRKTDFVQNANTHGNLPLSKKRSASTAGFDQDPSKKTGLLWTLKFGADYPPTSSSVLTTLLSKPPRSLPACLKFVKGARGCCLWTPLTVTPCCDCKSVSDLIQFVEDAKVADFYELPLVMEMMKQSLVAFLVGKGPYMYGDGRSDDDDLDTECSPLWNETLPI